MTATLANQQIMKGADPLASAQHKPLISNEKLKQLYAEMMRLRQQARLRSRSLSKQKAHWKFTEAPLIACTIDLRAEDSLITSTDFPSATNAQRYVLDHVDSVVPLGTGAALLHRIQAKGNVVVALVGAKQMESSREFLRVAYLQSLPIIYLQLEKACSKGAASAPSRIQIPSIPADRADVVAIYRVASEAIDKARRGAGPTVIQCMPFSLKNRKAIDHHSQDPIAYMEYYLRKKHLWSDDLNRTGGASRWAGDAKMASSARTM